MFEAMDSLKESMLAEVDGHHLIGKYFCWRNIHLIRMENYSSHASQKSHKKWSRETSHNIYSRHVSVETIISLNWRNNHLMKIGESIIS